MSDLPNVVSEYFAAIGRKGGGSTSEKKRRAVIRNLEAGRARRWPQAQAKPQPQEGEPDAATKEN